MQALLIRYRDEPITQNCRLADSIHQRPITTYNQPINQPKKSHTTLFVAMLVQNTELDKKTYIYIA